MAGYRFTVSGDAGAARETVYSVLEGQGFKVERTGDWTAQAERGSKGASIAFGALAGKKGRHVSIDISCVADTNGNSIITFAQGSKGVSGGLIGMGQASSVYSEVYSAISSTFQAAGVLLVGNQL